MNTWHVVHVHLRLQYALAQIAKRRLLGWCASDDEVWDHAFALVGDDAPMDDLALGFYWRHMRMYRQQVQGTSNFTVAAASTRGSPEDQAYNYMKLKYEKGGVHGGGKLVLEVRQESDSKLVSQEEKAGCCDFVKLSYKSRRGILVLRQVSVA
jgi:hypothetical protein